jgi:hypothetical protein
MEDHKKGENTMNMATAVTKKQAKLIEQVRKAWPFAIKKLREEGYEAETVMIDGKEHMSVANPMAKDGAKPTNAQQLGLMFEWRGHQHGITDAVLIERTKAALSIVEKHNPANLTLHPDEEAATAYNLAEIVGLEVGAYGWRLAMMDTLIRHPEVSKDYRPVIQNDAETLLQEFMSRRGVISVYPGLEKPQLRPGVKRLSRKENAKLLRLTNDALAIANQGAEVKQVGYKGIQSPAQIQRLMGLFYQKFQACAPLEGTLLDLTDDAKSHLDTLRSLMARTDLLQHRFQSMAGFDILKADGTLETYLTFRTVPYLVGYIAASGYERTACYDTMDKMVELGWSVSEPVEQAN